MKKSHLLGAVSACIFFIGAWGNIQAATVTLNHDGRGSYSEWNGSYNLSDLGSYGTGVYDATNLNFPHARNFFSFDLSAGITETILSGTLRIYNPAGGFKSHSNGPLILSMYDVSTSFSTLISGANASTTFNDLGTGSLYGQRVVDVSTNGNYVDINLTAAALSALQSATGLFSFGGKIEQENHLADRYMFWGSWSGNMPVTQLVLTTTDPAVVPIPAAVWLFGSGLLVLIGMARRKKAA